MDLVGAYPAMAAKFRKDGFCLVKNERLLYMSCQGVKPVK